MSDHIVVALDIGRSSVKSALVGRHRVVGDWYANADANALAEVFGSFGADLGAFLEPFVSAFHADAVLITGGIAEAWECCAPLLMRSVSIPGLKGAPGARAALLGAAALYFQTNGFLANRISIRVAIDSVVSETN